jgi:hypothetical protein
MASASFFKLRIYKWWQVAGQKIQLTGDTSANKDFPRGQVNGFATTWTLEK